MVGKDADVQNQGSHRWTDQERGRERAREGRGQGLGSRDATILSLRTQSCHNDKETEGKRKEGLEEEERKKRKDSEKEEEMERRGDRKGERRDEEDTDGEKDQEEKRG